MILYNNPIKYSKLILKYLNSGFDLNAIEGELEKLNTVTLDDYNRVANKYFNPDNFKVIITANKEPREFTNQFNGMSYVDEFGTSIERDLIPEKKDGIIDGCDLPENTLYLGESGEVFYNSSLPITSFSFKVDGAINYKGLEGEEETIIKPLVDDSGNSHAVKAGFEFSVNKKISSGDKYVVNGSAPAKDMWNDKPNYEISPGCGTLVELILDEQDAIGLSGIKVFDASQGKTTYFEYYNPESNTESSD